MRFLLSAGSSEGQGLFFLSAGSYSRLLQGQYNT